MHGKSLLRGSQEAFLIARAVLKARTMTYRQKPFIKTLDRLNDRILGKDDVSYCRDL